MTSAHVLAWAHGIGASGREPSSATVGARIACLSSYYRFLIRMNVTSVNPCDALERPKTIPSVARRSYGGGVLKMETKEAERLAVPVVSGVTAAAFLADFDTFDALVRAGRSAEASARVDELGFDHAALTEAANTYRRRRTERKTARPKSPGMASSSER